MTDKLNQIGLDNRASKELSDKLNELLANYQIFYMNARGFHWNIKGEKFFELHAKFEDLYNDSLEKIDEIAERILTLGFTPLHNYEDYSGISKIKASRNVSGGKDAVQAILDGYKVLLPLERELLEMAGESNDEGTGALMSDYIREQEKLVWMYSAFLNK
ncbi:DNA starvation/stationary phase protection protein [Muricauda ruestringensis]|jgi:starvation-inducible DNA-binding protein|uniref:DNA starvation/stationary phase protection protein n=1 Tax=Flagellimonas marinaquae TaxID=254955 RepID=A0AA48HF18_9FLAO|nr:Dps family protein [Allomuricauda ruestringensis]MCA0957790.1 DNA starvation/stationary phase protection protein [Allomuricauda ruestringensis]BDW93237.1 DNA starvation/stationary phase protection protein [Allomuricauda aquimarina]